MVKILGFVIDFQRDLRVGDKFQIFYSKKRDMIENKVIGTDPLKFVGIELSGNKLNYYRYTTNSGYTSYFDEKGLSSKKTAPEGSKFSSLSIERILAALSSQLILFAAKFDSFKSMFG